MRAINFGDVRGYGATDCLLRFGNVVAKCGRIAPQLCDDVAAANSGVSCRWQISRRGVRAPLEGHLALARDAPRFSCGQEATLLANQARQGAADLSFGA